MASSSQVGADVITTCTERFDGKLHDYAKQDDVREGFTTGRGDRGVHGVLRQGVRLLNC
jgi:hypothetical protein